jgi:histidinol dehydrogenase
MRLGSGPLKILGADTRGGRRALDRLVRRGDEILDSRILRQTERLVRAVRKKGDAALLDAVRRFDGVAVSRPEELRMTVPDVDEERQLLPPGFADALDRAAAAVERYHRRQVVPGFSMENDGVELTERRDPLSRVGIYVPGGRASYPSTVMMTVVPARLAGVREIVVATPPTSFHGNAALRYTLARLGVEEIWGMGGSHAVAALAYGTETVTRVDKIVGPGNAWVTAAKRLVLGDVGIDGLAGPTEVVIVAEGGHARAGDVASDLLAQAEHDPRAAAVLVTDDRTLAKEVSRELERQLRELPTAETARAALDRFGCALVMSHIGDALEVVDRLAPEHLQLVGPGAEALETRVRAAGAVFLGSATPEVFGDYVAGPSHVLPTCGSARFASALGVEDFIRRSHTVRFTPRAAARWADLAATLAEAEGLPAHAASARRRTAERGGE